MTIAVVEPQDPLSVDTGWRAELSLGFEPSHGATRMVRTHHCGPLRVQRPFYPEGDQGACHVYLLHPPGGMVAGDDLAMDFDLAVDSRVLLTTPSAGKVYRTAEHQARQCQRIHFSVAAGAVAEWLPQENIVFSGADVDLRTRIDLDKEASFIGWDLLCLGRQAGNHPFIQGRARQEFSVYRGGQPLFIEKGLFRAGDPLLTQRWGLQGQPVVGTLVCVWPHAEKMKRESLLCSLREQLSLKGEKSLWSVTDIDGVLVLRYLGDCTEEARNLFIRAWEILRPVVAGLEACRPRIWNT